MFRKKLMRPTDPGFNLLNNDLIKQAVNHFDRLSLADQSIICTQFGKIVNSRGSAQMNDSI